MRTGKLKCGIIAVLLLILLLTAISGVCLFNSAYAAEGGAYGENYRNRLAYSAKKGWNNDPNGLLYVDGVYHMYYQYNYDCRIDGTDGDRTFNGWGNMSWGHATSSDLVHWEEQPVAIPAYINSGGSFYGMFFSGSAVYDGRNTSGLFEDGKGGIVAIMTQPCWNEELRYDVQRQVLAYSDDGYKFEIYGEILGADDDGGRGDNEFRDPKVFWNASLGKWLMVVGGGSVRMYSSANLKDWEYLGETGLWGECPDVSRFVTDGEEKYVLIISPEDKAKSHEYNKTTRVDTYYPAEYYTVGELDENGLFQALQPLKRLSEGIDSYAFQSFNNAPDGKVYGVSWSASWLTVGEYEGLRENYNGGMTIACELKLNEEDGEYTLTRYPVAGFEELRGEKQAVEGIQQAGKNIFAGIKATEADVEAELDFTDSAATYAELSLRVSDAERILIRYDVAAETLTLDRSQSSLVSRDTKFFKDTYSANVPLKGNKLALRILLDRAFISLFANGGSASFFSAVFPSAVSDGIRLISDGNIGVRADIYNMESIFGEGQSSEKIVLTTSKIDMTVGESYPVIASSYSDSFETGGVSFNAAGDVVRVDKINGIAYVRALKEGYAEIGVTYPGQPARTIQVFVYKNGYSGNVKYTDRYRGYSYYSGDGLIFEAGGEDAFLFGDVSGVDFTYSAYFTPQNDAQAGGLSFGYTGNASGFWFVTADIKENRVKLVQFNGEKEAAEVLKSAKYNFAGNSRYKLTLSVSGGEVKAYVNDENAAVIIHKLAGYAGGRAGLNVFDSKMAVNRVAFRKMYTADGCLDLGGDGVVKVVNVTDGSYRLQADEYSVVGGKLIISEDYLSTLEQDAEYSFKVITSSAEYGVTVKTDFTAASVTPLKQEYFKGDRLAFAVSEGTEVYKVEINGKECAFTRENNVITLDTEGMSLTGGTHTVKVYTAKGRPTASFVIRGLDDFREEEIEEISHTFFYIDIAIFATLIIAYVTFTLVRKYRTK